MKSILITGASRGIGHATAELFLKSGWHVYGTSTTGNIQLSHEGFEAYALDLSNTDSLNNFEKTFGKNNIDVLLNNAGIGPDESSAPPIRIDVLRQDLEVNLIGTIRLSEIVLENIETNGKIINTSSLMAAMNQDFTYGDPSYRISKAALNMFTLNLAKDPRVLAKNIDVCSFDPGWVRTDMGGLDAPRKPEEPAQELFELATKGFETGKFYKGQTIRTW